MFDYIKAVRSNHVFLFKSVFDLVNISVGEITVYDENQNPIMQENVEGVKIEIPGEQVEPMEGEIFMAYVSANYKPN